MQYDELVKQIDFLMSASLAKCGDIQEAEDLTQETLLAALTCLSRGKTIDNPRAWLLTVMNRRFYDRMRRKYHMPVIRMGEDFDLADDTDIPSQVSSTLEAEAVRREVAYLGRLYRETIVRYYMEGQGIPEIAAALGIPQGTVKSRLHTGRNQIQKGMTTMENYTKQSYAPVTLHVTSSGRMGPNGEPMSLAENDLMAQNLLWLAYGQPASAEELARSIGIPAAYVEPVLEKLTAGELMKKTGGKYRTDFIIYTKKDQAKYLPEQGQLVQEHFSLLWKAIGQGLDRLRRMECCQNYSDDQKNSLELYFAFKCLDNGIYEIFNDIFHSDQDFPNRPNGGRWIAFGFVTLGDKASEEYQTLKENSYSGERWEALEDYAGSKQIELRVYDADGFPAPSYKRPPDHAFFQPYDNKDALFLKLLYILQEGINPQEVGFNIEAMKAIPWLVQCKVLRLENEKPRVNIPVLNPMEFQSLMNLCKETTKRMGADLKGLFTEFYQGKQLPIPAHLENVPLKKRFLHADNILVFRTIREAMGRGMLCDRDYGDGTGQVPCPMVLMVEQKAP